MKKNPKGAQLAGTFLNCEADDDAIRKRAYELYIDRGMEDGHDLEDWLRAEQELASRRSQSAAA